MEKLITLSLFFIFSVYGITPENIFLNEETSIEKIFYLHNAQLQLPQAVPLAPSSTFDNLMLSTHTKIDPLFFVPPYLITSVKFWFEIYSLYDLEQVVIHDRDRHAIKYDALNFAGLHNSIINRFVRYDLQDQLVIERVKEIKVALPFVLTNPNNNPITAKLITDFSAQNIAIPKSKKERKTFINNLVENVRAQSGQKNSVHQALQNLSPFYPSILKIFETLEAPKELIAIPIVESSFNIQAISKASAIGPWQFIKQTGKSFLLINDREDGRLNPLLSTLAAIHLLKQNFKMLKSWEFAITAYNVGPDHVVRAKKLIPPEMHTLEHLFDKYNNPEIGFASQNYYSEFLAMVYVIFNRDVFFPDLAIDPKDTLNSTIFSPYLTLCSFVPNKTIKVLTGSNVSSSSEYAKNNNHLLFPDKSYPRGTIFFSRNSLTSKRFLKITDDQMKNIFPLKWNLLVSGKKCIKD